MITWHNSRQTGPLRDGISLLELVVSMSAATMLMIGMSMSLGVVLQSADAIESLDRSDDGVLRDWIQDDLRYTTQIQSSASNEWSLQRVTTNGVSETVGYRVNNDGLQRNVDNGSWSTIAPSIVSLSIDRAPYSIEFEANQIEESLTTAGSHTEVALSPASQSPEIVGVRTAATTSDSSELTIEIPPSASLGDWLVLAGGSRGSGSLEVSDEWTTRVSDSQWTFGGTVRMQVWTRAFEPAIGLTVTLESSSDRLINATMLAIRGADPSDPFAAVTSVSRSFILSGSQATPGYRDSTDANELNLQILAVTAPTDSTPSMGMPGYADVASIVNPSSRDWAIYASTRQGSLHSTTTLVQGDVRYLSSYVLASLRIRP